MPQILDYFLSAAYGQVCLTDQDAELPAESDPTGAEVLADPDAIVVAVADEEPEDPVEVEVYQGTDEVPRLAGFERIFTGPLTLSRPGMLVFAPTGEEVLLREVADGQHQVAIYRDGYPTSRLVVLLDGPANGSQPD
jgi:hypothetical protein